jgi:hypothetical protein
VASGLAHGASAAEAAGPPIVVASWVTDVSATAANLRAEINPNGLPTNYRFEYVGEAAFEQSGFTGATKVPLNGASVGAGTGTAPPLVQHIGGLAPLSIYHYRVSVTNSAATVLGPEHSLMTEETAPVFHLPDARGWEMVSPIDKDGGAIGAPGALYGGGDFQAAAASPTFTYTSATAFGQAQGAPPASQYLSSRSASGWSTQNVSTPLQSGSYGDEPSGVPYRLFGEDLSHAALFGGNPCRGAAGCPEPTPPLAGSGAPVGYPELYLRANATGSLQALVSQADLSHAAISPEAFEANLVAAASDLSHLVISSCAALTADATEVSAGPGKCSPAAQNLYRWSSAGLALINLLPGDPTGTPGAEIAASLSAISSDGSRVYFTHAGDLYLREGETSKLLAAGAEFQAASAADGAVAYFTKAAHLYRYEAPGDITTDLTPSGGVAGVLAVSPDGASVFYQDPTALQLWHEGTTTAIAPGAAAAMSVNWPPATGAARLSADGAHLAFLSAAELTDYDNAGHVEAYLYGPPPGGGPAQLHCASCNPTGERPQGFTAIPGAPPNGKSPLPYKPRALAADGQRLFFESNDDLLSRDTNERTDVYQWEAQGKGDCLIPGGCIGLISSGRSPEGASFLDASLSGSDAYFLTDGSLVGTDPGSIDVYDAREGGGFEPPLVPIPCEADACQALPPSPEDPAPGTLLVGPENPPLHFVEEKKPKHDKKKHKKKPKHQGKKNHKQGRGR